MVCCDFLGVFVGIGFLGILVFCMLLFYIYKNRDEWYYKYNLEIDYGIVIYWKEIKLIK